MVDAILSYIRFAQKKFQERLTFDAGLIVGASFLFIFSSFLISLSVVEWSYSRGDFTVITEVRTPQERGRFYDNFAFGASLYSFLLFLWGGANFLGWLHDNWPPTPENNPLLEVSLTPSSELPQAPTPDNGCFSEMPPIPTSELPREVVDPVCVENALLWEYVPFGQDLESQALYRKLEQQEFLERQKFLAGPGPFSPVNAPVRGDTLTEIPPAEFFEQSIASTVEIGYGDCLFGVFVGVMFVLIVVYRNYLVPISTASDW